MYPRTESGEDEDSGWRPLAVTQTGAGRQADDWGDGQYSNFNSSQGGIKIGVAWMVAWVIVRKDQWSSTIIGKQSQVEESSQALCL